MTSAFPPSEPSPRAPVGDVRPIAAGSLVLVHALDMFCAAAWLILVVAVLGDGLRLSIGGMRLTATSPLRVVVFLTVLTAVRHALLRRPHQWERAVAISRALRAAESLRAVWPVWLATRAAVLIVGYLAVVLFGFAADPGWHISSNAFLNLPARWDAGWYLTIALDGYSWNPNLQGQQNVAFFPGYPLLIRAVGALVSVRRYVPIGQDFRDESLLIEHVKLAWVAVGLSLAAFLWAATYTYRLARHLLGDERGALSSILLLAAYPFAIFYGGVYTESIFLLAAAGAFFHLSRREYLPAAMWGAVAGFVKPNGCLLSVPLAVLVVADTWRSRDPRVGVLREPASRAVFAKGIAAASTSGLAMLAFTAYLYELSGRWFLWLDAHKAWGRTYHRVDTLFTERYSFIQQHGLYQYSSTEPYDLLNALPVVLMLLLTIAIWRRLGAAYAVYVLVNLVPPLAAGGFLSMGRVTSVMFPVFLYLGGRLGPRQTDALVVSFAIGQGLLAALFYTWRPLY